MSALLKSLKAKYPNKEFAMDPESAVIGFSFEDMWITDAFVSECGRFRMKPSYYGLDMESAIGLFRYNLPLLNAQEFQNIEASYGQ